MPKSGLDKRAGLMARFDVLSFLAGLVEKVISNFGAITSYIGGGALMGWLVYLEGVRPWVWGAGFFAGLFAVAAIRAVTAYSQNQRAEGEFRKLLAAPPETVNPLRQSFDRERIRVSDFWNTFVKLRHYKGTAFRNCQLHGPGAIVFWHGCTLRQPEFLSCDLVCVNNAHIHTAVVFENATFDDCAFVSTTLYLSRNICDLLVDEFKKSGTTPLIIGYNEKAPA